MSLNWSQTPKTGFLVTWLFVIYICNSAYIWVPSAAVTELPETYFKNPKISDTRKIAVIILKGVGSRMPIIGLVDCQKTGTLIITPAG